MKKITLGDIKELLTFNADERQHLVIVRLFKEYGTDMYYHCHYDSIVEILKYHPELTDAEVAGMGIDHNEEREEPWTNVIEICVVTGY